ncbi:MAG: LuxR C-terminal-related transcriptional regulator [Syntrophobacteraceae bacterium]
MSQGPSSDPARLRVPAEEQFKTIKDLESGTLSREEIRLLIHQLRVHQIEMEMQNEELRNAQAALEVARARYFDLYDLAPVGYCTLSTNGLILEANLTAATLFGTHRGALTQQRFSGFVHVEDEKIYYSQLKRLFESSRPQRCELRMLSGNGEPFWARLESVVSRGEDGAPVCRMIIGDNTEGRRIEQELRESRSELLLRVKELEEHANNLQEVNIALRVLLKQKEADQKEFSETVLLNVRNLVLPYIEKLRKARLASAQATLVEILETHLNEVTSTFTKKIGVEAADLTPAEMRVAALIRDGKSSAEIAQILSASEKTIETHRVRIRKKLGLQSRSANLRSHLLKLS